MEGSSFRRAARIAGYQLQRVYRHIKPVPARVLQSQEFRVEPTNVQSIQTLITPDTIFFMNHRRIHS